MSETFASNELTQQIFAAQEKRQTAAISVTEELGGKRTYGLLQFVQGKLTAAKYGSFKGSEALQVIRGLGTPILSVASGVLLRDEDTLLNKADAPLVQKQEVRPVAKAQLEGISWVDSIQTKVSFLLVLVTTLLLAGFGAYNVFNFRNSLFTDLDTLAKSSSEQLSINLTLPLWNLDRETIAKVIEAEMSDDRIQTIIIRDEDGETIFAGKQRDDNWSIVDTNSEVANLDGLTMVEEEVFSPQGDASIGAAEVYVTSRFVQEEVQQSIIAELLRTIILDIVIILAVSLVLRRLLIQPVLSLTQSAEDLSKGKSAQINIRSKDEIGRLAQAFERLRISLNVAMKHMKS